MLMNDYSDKDRELVYAIALTLVKHIGPRVGIKLLKHFGNAESIFSASYNSFKQIGGMSSKLVEELLHTKDFSQAASHIDFAKKQGIQVLYILNADYPKRLKNCEDAPILLYYKGNANLNASKVISVVGTREASVFGTRLCTQFVESFKGTDTLIVSGLAYGIDISTHKACLTNQVSTVAVLGHGLDKIYPAPHYNIA